MEKYARSVIISTFIGFYDFPYTREPSLIKVVINLIEANTKVNG